MWIFINRIFFYFLSIGPIWLGETDRQWILNISEFLLLFLLLLSSCPTQGSHEKWRSPYLWNVRIPADCACRTITGADEMKWHEMNEMRVEKWWDEIIENGRKPIRPRPTDSVSSTMRTTWCDQDANSGFQRLEASH